MHEVSSEIFVEACALCSTNQGSACCLTVLNLIEDAHLKDD